MVFCRRRTHCKLLNQQLVEAMTVTRVLITVILCNGNEIALPFYVETELVCDWTHQVPPVDPTSRSRQPSSGENSRVILSEFLQVMADEEFSFFVHR